MGMGEADGSVMIAPPKFLAKRIGVMGDGGWRAQGQGH